MKSNGKRQFLIQKCRHLHSVDPSINNTCLWLIRWSTTLYSCWSHNQQHYSLVDFSINIIDGWSPDQHPCRLIHRSTSLLVDSSINIVVGSLFPRTTFLAVDPSINITGHWSHDQHHCCSHEQHHWPVDPSINITGRWSHDQHHCCSHEQHLSKHSRFSQLTVSVSSNA